MRRYVDEFWINGEVGQAPPVREQRLARIAVSLMKAKSALATSRTRLQQRSPRGDEPLPARGSEV